MNVITQLFTSDRKTKRRQVRAELAQVELHRRRAAELSKQLQGLDARADAAADRHQDATGPIQERLSEIDDRLRALIADRKPTDRKLEVERQKLLDALALANEALQAEVALVKALRLPLAKERSEAEKQTHKYTVLQNQLVGEECGDEDLLDQAFIARQQSDWLFARQRTAAEKLAKAEAHLRDVVAHDKATRGKLDYASEIALSEKKVRRWRKELGAVSKLQAAAQAESERIRQALLDE